jgi:hypothetical protein
MKLHKHATKIFRLAVLLGVLGTPTAGAAGDDGGSWWPEDSGNFSYTYLQGSYGLRSHSSNDEYGLIGGRASIDFGGLFYLSGTVEANEEQEFSVVTSTAYSAHFGAHGSVSDHIDILLDVGYASLTPDTPNSLADADGPVLGFGFRGTSPERLFEAELRYSHYWMEGVTGVTEDNGMVSVDFLWRATSHLGVVVRGTLSSEAEETVGSYSSGLRIWL